MELVHSGTATAVLVIEADGEIQPGEVVTSRGRLQPQVTQVERTPQAQPVGLVVATRMANTDVAVEMMQKIITAAAAGTATSPPRICWTACKNRQSHNMNSRPLPSYKTQTKIGLGTFKVQRGEIGTNCPQNGKKDFVKVDYPAKT